jgi:hypothetical protein
MTASRPFDDGDRDKRADDGVKAGAGFDGGGSSGAVAQAVCSTRRVKVPMASRRLSGLSDKTVKVGCPRGTSVSAGGASTDNADARHNSSYPYDDGDANETPGDGWAVRVFNSSIDGARIKAYAVCTRRPIDYAITESTEPAGSPTYATLTCPELGQVAIGGGVRFDGLVSAVRLIEAVSRDDVDALLVPGDQIEFGYDVDGDSKSLTRTVVCA